MTLPPSDNELGALGLHTLLPSLQSLPQLRLVDLTGKEPACPPSSAVQQTPQDVFVCLAAPLLPHPGNRLGSKAVELVLYSLHQLSQMTTLALDGSFACNSSLLYGLHWLPLTRRIRSVTSQETHSAVALHR